MLDLRYLCHGFLRGINKLTALLFIVFTLD